MMLHIRWQGGACSDAPVELPPNMPDRIRYPVELVERIRTLAETLTDAQIADLHAVGVRGTRFNFVAHLGGAPELDVFWRLVERVQPFGWHIVLHFDAKDLPDYATLLDRMPCAYVIDHMARVPAAGGLDQEPFQYLLDMLATDERAWVKVSGAERITAVIPFYGYARQDKKGRPREAITAKLMGDLFVTAGADRIVGMDAQVQLGDGSHLVAEPRTPEVNVGQNAGRQQQGPSDQNHRSIRQGPSRKFSRSQLFLNSTVRAKTL